jgi:hypothetical protein
MKRNAVHAEKSAPQGSPALTARAAVCKVKHSVVEGFVDTSFDISDFLPIP